VLAAALWENDWIRIRIATISYTLLGIFQLVAVARYHGSSSWGVAGEVYVAFVASVLLLGVYGWIQASSRAVKPREE
jgi:hypothetical protein